MRPAFISILRRLLGPQFDFLAIICSQIAFFVNFNFRVLRGFHSLSRQHRPNSGFSSTVQRDWTMCSWNSKGSSQLLNLHFQFLIQRSSVLLTDPSLYTTTGRIRNLNYLFFIWQNFEVHFLFIEFIDFTVRIVAFLALYRGFWDGEGHYTSNSGV